MGRCYTNAITKFLDEYVWDGSDQENERATCNRYLNQAKCYTEGGPQGLKCWEDEDVNNGPYNVHYDEEFGINRTTRTVDNAWKLRTDISRRLRAVTLIDAYGKLRITS